MSSCKVHFRRGFSSIELLTVIAIIALLSSVLAPALTSLGSGTALGTEGNRLSDLMSFARQNAMARNTLTAVVMVSEPGAEKRNRAFAIFELAAKSAGAPGPQDWRQILKWEILRQGAVADSCTFPDQSKSPPVPFPAFSHEGQAVDSYRYALFSPNGAMLEENPIMIRLVEGVWPASASTATLTRPGAGGGPANYFQIYLVPSTGRQKIERP